MSRKRVIFYTDCFIFGGCEKPIFEVMSSRDFRSRYDYLLVYRSTKEYNDGMVKSFPSFSLKETREVKLCDINTWYHRLENGISDAYLLTIVKKLAAILFRLLKPFIFAYDFMVLYFLFSNETADIVHINNGGYPGAPSCRAAVIAARRSGHRCILLGVHNIASKPSGLIDPIVDFFVRRSVSTVISVSEASASALCSNRKFDKNRVINIYNGVKEIAAAKKDSNHRQISMVGRFEERKGHRFAVQALKRVLAEHPELVDTKIFFMGDGPLLPEIKKLAQKEGLENNVVFMGYRNDCLDYVASSQFLINPSLEYESLPYSIIEAMSVATPVIGTDVGGIREEIEDGISGIIVPPGDDAALAHAMFTLLVDDDKRAKMAAAAKRRFDALFSLDRMIKSYIALYDKVAL